MLSHGGKVARVDEDQFLIDRAMGMLRAEGRTQSADVLAQWLRLRRPDPRKRWNDRWVLWVDEAVLRDVTFDVKNELKRVLNQLAGVTAAYVVVLPPYAPEP
jgi:hypothetical protein